MLLALLYQADGQLTGAALACDQQPFGNRFWREIYTEKVNIRDSETAYVDIDDQQLAERLLNMDFPNGVDAAEAVDTYLGLATSGSGSSDAPHWPVRRA